MAVSVFVSSRFEEFASLRSRLPARIDATKDMRAVALDDGHSSVDDALSRSLSELHRSDVMVLLLGSTYSDGPLLNGKSLTQLEYETACERGNAVLAFAPLGCNFKDARAHDFAKKVMASSVVGTLLEDDEDSCDRILDSIRDYLLVLDYLSDARGDVHGTGRWLLRELGELDAGYMLKDTPSSDFTSRFHSYTELLEQRRFALYALTIGQLGSARQHITNAHGLHEGDWGVEYIAARLAEARGLRTDRAVALDHARRALRIVDSSEVPIDPEPLTPITRACRRQACLLLLARLCRRKGDVRAAEDYLRQAADRAATDAALAGTPFELDTLKARLDAEWVRLLGGSSDESAEEIAAGRFLDLLRDHPAVAVPLVNANEVDRFRDRLRLDGLAEVKRLIGNASDLGIPPQQPAPPLSRLPDAVEAARGHADVAAQTLRRHIWSVQALLADRDDEGAHWLTEALSSQLLQLENEQRTRRGRYVNAVAKKNAAEEAAGLDIDAPSADLTSKTPTPSHEPRTDGAADAVDNLGSGQVGGGPPDPDVHLAEANGRLAVSEQRLAELTQRLTDTPDPVAPSPLVPWPAWFGVAIIVMAIVVALLLQDYFSAMFTTSAFGSGVLLVVFVYREAVGPYLTRWVLRYQIRSEKSRRSAAQSSVEQLRAVVEARRAVKDIGAQLAALDSRCAKVRRRLGEAMEAQAQVARSLGQTPNATGSDLVLELNRLKSQFNQVFSECPAIWWPQFVVAGLATPGALTSVASREAQQGALLGTLGSGDRLVRVLEVTSEGLVVSDLSAVFPRPEPEVLRLESPIKPPLALSAGDARPLQSAGTQEPEPRSTGPNSGEPDLTDEAAPDKPEVRSSSLEP